jgi:copper homeostasis protein CutC
MRPVKAPTSAAPTRRNVSLVATVSKTTVTVMTRPSRTGSFHYHEDDDKYVTIRMVLCFE